MLYQRLLTYITIKYIVLLVLDLAILFIISLKININNYDDIKEGDKVLINQFVYQSGKKLVVGKFKQKTIIFKLPCTILSNYGGGLLAISIFLDNYEFNKNEEYLIESKLCTLIDKEKYDKIIF